MEICGSFDRFVGASRQRLHRVAYRLCGDWHEAEDLVQNALCRLHQHWGRLSDHDQLVGYACRTLLNVYLDDHRRHRWTREVSHAELADISGTAAAPVEDHVVLIAVVQQLPTRQREVIALRFWGDLTIEETANVLNCSIGTVTTHTHRALSHLRSALTDGGSLDASRVDIGGGCVASGRREDLPFPPASASRKVVKA